MRAALAPCAISRSRSAMRICSGISAVPSGRRERAAPCEAKRRSGVRQNQHPYRLASAHQQRKMYLSCRAAAGDQYDGLTRHPPASGLDTQSAPPQAVARQKCGARRMGRYCCHTHRGGPSRVMVCTGSVATLRSTASPAIRAMFATHILG
jgi:hypothetical protein